jgi:S-adenosylmethionine:tRNA ribosyltransferase-isomerase
MRPATWPREEPLDERLLVVDPCAGGWLDAHVRDLAVALAPGDLLVVNDAATLPASLPVTIPVPAAPVGASGIALELRLAARLPDGTWRAVLFGAGDWRTPTEHRPAPPTVAPGTVLRIAADLHATVEDVDARTPRLVVVRFSLDPNADKGAARSKRADPNADKGTARSKRADPNADKGAARSKRADPNADEAVFWAALYRYGRPIQYSYVARPLEAWHVQTALAARPWAVEMPSAGRPLTWALLAALRARGVRLAAITHAAGLSSTGDARIDAALPLPERFDVPEATVRAIAETRRRGGRVVAVGTTVVRALEGCARLHEGDIVAGEGTTDLRIDARFRPRVVDGLLTGLHEAGSSHRELLQAFAPEALLARAWDHAEASGYLDHEFGDSFLVLPSAARARRLTA